MVNRTQKQVTIANSASLSAVFELKSRALRGIYMPADWTSAGISFLGALKEDGTYQVVKDDGGTEITLTVADDIFVVLSTANTEKLKALTWVKLRSGTSGSPVTQGGDRVLTLIFADD